MLLIRKLIIAVLTLGLVFAFSNAAISADSDGRTVKIEQLKMVDPDAALYDEARLVAPEVPEVTKPLDLQPANFELWGDDPELRACHRISYYGSFNYQWDVPDADGDSIFAMRFTPERACTLLTPWVALAVGAGTPSMRMFLWEDDGTGLPGTEIAHWDFDNSYMPPAGYYTWLGVDASSDAGGATFPDDFVFGMGEEFHIGFKTIDGEYGVNHLLAFTDDASGAQEYRGTEFTTYSFPPPGGWELFYTGWGVDFNFLIRADLCYEEGDFSNCYYNYDACPNPGGNYVWWFPNDYGLQYQTQRFSVTYPETLKTVSVSLHSLTLDYGPVDMDIWIYPSVGGFPDVGNPYTGGPVATVPYAELNFHGSYSPPLPPIPSGWTTADISSLGLVMTSDYHVGIEPNPATWEEGDTLVLSGDFAECGEGRSSGYDANYGCGWVTFADPCFYGIDINFQIAVNACQDIYAQCYWDWNVTGDPLGGMGFPSDGLGTDAWAELITNNLGGCELGEIEVAFCQFASPPLATYAYPAELAVYDSDGPDGLPGTKLLWAPMDAPYTTGAWTGFPIEGELTMSGDVWLVIQSFAPADRDMCLYLTPGVPHTLADRWLGEWEYSDSWMGDDYAYYMDWYLCCVPLEIDICAPDGDWPRWGKDALVKYRSLNEVGDVQCKLTKSWSYIATPVGTQDPIIFFTTPVIYKDTVVCVFTNKIVSIDLNTGAEIAVRNTNYGEIGGTNSSTPTIHPDETGKAYVYVGAGDNRYFNKLDLANNLNTVWSYSTDAITSFSPNFIVSLGDPAEDVVFFSDDYGNLYAVKCSDGSDWYGTGTNPFFTATGFVYRGLATDGEYLYVGCDAYDSDPNLFCLDLADGSEVWNLVDDGPGFKLPEVAAGWTHPEESYENILSSFAISDEGPEGRYLYFQTGFAPQAASPTHNGGLIYALNLDDLTYRWSLPAEGNGSSSGYPSAIINDKAQIIFGAWSNWNEGGNFYGPWAYSKRYGTYVWGQQNDVEPQYSIATNPDVWGHVSQPGLLTCETIADPEASDWLIYGNEHGYFNFADAVAGEVIWHRRCYYGTGYSAGPIMDEGHILLSNANVITCMTNQTNRQRLHITRMEPTEQVDFGLTSYEEVTFEDVLYNSGCAPLRIFSVDLLEEDNGTYPITAVTHERSALAEKIAQTAGKGYYDLAEAVTEKMNLISPAKPTIVKTRQSAAYAIPEYIIDVIAPVDNTDIPPGGYEDIVVSIDGTKIPRGKSSVYCEIDSDDPDYFIDYAYKDDNSDYAKPSILLSFVGGCVYDYTTLYFGDAGANWTSVWNSTKISKGDPIDAAVMIDGEAAYVFTNDGMIYCADTQWCAMHWNDGWGNDMFEGVLPDPYPGCDFAENHDIVLAKMSNTGALPYGDVLGTIINYAYVDSIEDLRLWEIDEITEDTLGYEWTWSLEFDLGVNMPYSSELTEGFAFKTFVAEYAVTDVTGGQPGFEDFWNFMIARHKSYSRYGYAIPHVFIGSVTDWDVDDFYSNDARANEEYSIEWTVDKNSLAFGGGYAKIPFGEGYDPLIGVVDATTDWYGDWLYDSCYIWMAHPRAYNYSPFGETDGTGAGNPVNDRRTWASHVRFDYPAWDYVDDESPVPDSAFQEYAYVFFGKFVDPGTAGDVANFAPISVLANKLCGFGRGDVNDDGAINLVDVVYLSTYVFRPQDAGYFGPKPFLHLGDVDIDGDVDVDDVTYMVNWYFYEGPAPQSDWNIPFVGFTK